MRNKVLAVSIGPAGLGIVGLFTNIIATGAAVAGMGLGLSAVRRLAVPATHDAARATLWRLSWPLGIVAAASMWFLRMPIARLTFESEDQATAVGLLGIGVALSLVSVAQGAVLQGLQRIAALAKARIAGAVAGTMGAVAAVLAMGNEGLLLAALAVPTGGVIGYAIWYPWRAPRQARRPNGVADEDGPDEHRPGWIARCRHDALVNDIGLVSMVLDGVAGYECGPGAASARRRRSRSC